MAAVTITEILGTDSISASRKTINDNFSVLANEINLIENFLIPSDSTITNLDLVSTNRLTVGSKFIINNTNITASLPVVVNSKLTTLGLLINNSINSTTKTSVDGVSQNIGTSSSSPDKRYYRVGNSTSQTTTDLILNLYNGEAGQEITFVYEGGYTGNVVIVAGGTTVITLPNSATSITLSSVGQSVTLVCITNKIGNLEWYLVSNIGAILS